MKKGVYLYCITNKIEKVNFGPMGINGSEVRVIVYKDINAVVSDIPIINFDRLDKKELIRHVTAHQKVNEEIMSAKGGSASGGKDYDVIPITFGVIAPDVAEVSRILERAYLQFKTALKKIKGKVEFIIQVHWDQKKLLEELANTNPEIQKLKQKLSSKGSILGIPMKLKLGKLIQKEAEIRRQTFINEVHASLRNLSFDSTSNKLIDDACPVGPDVTSGSFGEIIANFSFLIEKAKESELDKTMQELGKKYEGKLRFKYIGPMPPYSFVNINLSLGNFELVNEARKLLGLSEDATFDEIKKAYFILAHQYHPDKLQGDEKQMKKIAQAYHVLENYCQSYDDFKEKTEDQKYSFREEDVKAAILIH